MALPPVEIKLAPVGLDQVKAALKSTRDALKELENQQSAEKLKAARLREGYAKAEADAEVREFKRALAEKSRAAKAAPELNAFGDVRRTGSASRGLRELSSSAAFEQVFGKTTASLLGLHGEAGRLTGGIALLGGIFHGFGIAANFALSALQQFGGFLLTDIVKPQLDLGVKSQQLANRIGGDASGEQIQSAINKLYATNAQADLSTVTKVFEIAATRTKNSGQAEDVASLALQANKAYGFDAAKMAELIGKKAAANPGLNSEQFRGFISAQIAAAGKGSTSPEEFAAQFGRIEDVLAKFGGGGTAADKAARETSLMNLLSFSTGRGGKPLAETRQLDALVTQIANNANHPAFKGAVGPGGQVDLVKAISGIFAATGGDIQKLAPGPKMNVALGQQVGGMSEGALKFLRNLSAMGLGDAFKNAGGGEAGAAAVAEQLKAILDPAADASKMVTDAKKVEAETGYRLDQAWRTVESALIAGIVPALEKNGPLLAEQFANIATTLSEVDWKTIFDVTIMAFKDLAFGVLTIAATFSSDAETALKKLQIATDPSVTTTEKYVREHVKGAYKQDIVDYSNQLLTPQQIGTAYDKGKGTLDSEKLTAMLFANQGKGLGQESQIKLAEHAAGAGLDPKKIGDAIGGEGGKAFAALIKQIEIKIDSARTKSMADRPVQ